MMSGRISCAGMPVRRETSNTLAMGTASHCEIAERVTPNAVANLETPPARRTALSLGFSKSWFVMISDTNHNGRRHVKRY